MRALALLAMFMILALAAPSHAQEAALLTPYTVAYESGGAYHLAPVTLNCSQAPSSVSATLKLYVVGEDGKVTEETVEVETALSASGKLCTIVFPAGFKVKGDLAGLIANITLVFGEGESSTKNTVIVPVVLAQLPDTSGLESSISRIEKAVGQINETIAATTNSAAKLNQEVSNVSESLQDLGKRISNSKRVAVNLSKTLAAALEKADTLSSKLSDLSQTVTVLNGTIYNLTVKARGVGGLDYISLGQLALTIAAIALVGLVYVKVRGTPEILE